MTLFSLKKRAAIEFLGTALLLATVVGSGIMAERLAGGSQALALLGNTIPTGAILVVLILMFGPMSGAHFNPAVTLVFFQRGETSGKDMAAYIPAQILGAVSGVILAHAMFAEPLIQVSAKARDGAGQALGELVATFGLVVTILGVKRSRPDAVAVAVGLYITAAYWFTSSTSFANPAVTIARSLTRSFSGIAPANVAVFILAQLAGTAAAIVLFHWLEASAPPPDRTAAL